jgi:hypothetical protein
MSVSLSPYAGAGAQFFDNNGNPLAGGKIFTYAAGTTTELATYTDYTGGTANPVYPVGIVLDSAGRTPAQIWLTEGSSYKFVLETALGVTIKTDDNIFASYELAKEVNVAVGKGFGGLTSNIAVGDSALANLSSGSAINNTAVGYDAAYGLNTASNNTAVGALALYSGAGAGYSTAIGSQAMYAGANAYGTAVGYRAAYNDANQYNVAVGYDALFASSSGSDNTAVGAGALDAYLGSDAVGIGRSALSANTTGTGNTAVGKDAALLVVTGAYNVAVGWTALDAATTSNNTAVGASALGALTSGANNVALGFQAGDALTTGSNNVVIGYDADVSAAGVSNEITLGNSSITSMRAPGLTLTVGLKWINNGTHTVTDLLADAPAATVGAGARAVVTDANATTFHAIVAGGGANVVPVFSDGTDWRIG